MTSAEGAADSTGGPAGNGRPSGPGPDEPEHVVIRDKRRIDVDPAVDADIDPAAGDRAPDAVTFDPLLAELQQQVEERTSDLQRLQAEYANYRKRVDRDRITLAEAATGSVVSAFLPVLDDLDRARTHDDLTGPLKSLADQIEGTLAKFGLITFGEVGDPFDPTIHEAVLHDESADVQVPTCTTVMRKGYRLGDRLLRAAMVGVSDPA
jgi:molecular chaperone GrpE